MFTVQKGCRSHAVEGAQIAALEYLQPALRQIASAQVRQAQLSDQLKSLQSALETKQTGVLALGPDGKVQEMNAIASDMVQAGDGLSLRAGRLQIWDVEAQRVCDFACASMQAVGIQSSPGVQILASRPSSLPPFLITVCAPMPERSDDRAPNSGFLVMIEDPSAGLAVGIAQLRSAYGFTKAEARVAVLICNGQTASEIALAAHVGLATVRTQIQKIMQKMGVRRQVDVARILSRYL